MPKPFRTYFSAVVVSELGSGITAAALPILAARLTDSPVLISLIAVAQSVPWLFFSLPAGVLIDRWDKQKILIAANYISFVIMGMLSILVAYKLVSIYYLIFSGFAFGCVEVFSINTAQTFLPVLVAKESLTEANGRVYAAETVLRRFAGPPLGSLLASIALAGAFGTDAATFITAGLLISLISITRPPAAPGGEKCGLAKEIKEGIKYVWDNNILRTMALITTTANFCFSALNGVYVLFVTKDIGVPGPLYGVMLSCMALGGTLGSLFAGRLKNKYGEAAVLKMTTALTPAGFIITPLFHSPWVVAGAGMINGFIALCWNIVAVSYRQQVVPQHILGRVNSFNRLMSWGSIPLGSLAGGIAAQWVGLSWPYVIFGLISVVNPVLCFKVISQVKLDRSKNALLAS